jgi:hypothetical protein
MRCSTQTSFTSPVSFSRFMLSLWRPVAAVAAISALSGCALFLGIEELDEDDPKDPDAAVDGSIQVVDASPPDSADASIPPIDASPPNCRVGVTVEYTGTVLPSDINGFYAEAFDCQREEGGAWFGGVDYMHCMRKDDGSPWRIWNTGCGWEIGLIASQQPDWERHARYYTGLCSEIPPEGLTTDALTTTVFYDGFGQPISFLSTAYACTP